MVRGDLTTRPPHGNDMKHPKISVIVPVYNRETRVTRTIQSLLRQSFLDFEVIIVDDGSTDNTLARVRSFDDPRFRVVTQANAGAPAARNHGLNVATGEFVVFLDSDDLVDDDWLDSFARLIGPGDCALASCGLRIVDESLGEVIATITPKDLGPAFESVVGYFLAGSFCIRRDLVVAVGGYSNIPAAQQQELALRLCRVIAEQGLQTRSDFNARYTYVVHGDPHVRSNFRAIYLGDKYVIDVHGEQLKKSPEKYAKFLGEAAVCAVRIGEHEDARRLFWRLALYSPFSARAWFRLGLALSPAVAQTVWPPRVADSPVSQLGAFMRKVRRMGT